METEEVELKVEDLDKYCEAAASVVEELRDFLASHHADLIHRVNIHGRGVSTVMPAAASDPAYAGSNT